MLIDKDIDWKEALPNGSLPDGALRQRLSNVSKDLNFDLDCIKKDPKKYVEMIKIDPSSCIKIVEVVKTASAKTLFECRDVVEVLPRDLIREISNKWNNFSRNFLAEFCEAKIDSKTSYPNIYEHYFLKLET